MDGRVCQAGSRSERVGGGGVLWRAPAKLNLTLAVGPRRADGYHDLDSIVAKVTLYDELVFRPRPEAGIRLACGPFDCGPAERNLVWRAAECLGIPKHDMPADSAGMAPVLKGVEIEIRKRIPPGAGLGGGSSDAAAALMALNELWGLGLTEGELAERGAALGSDVPLFLAGGPGARIRGRGERVERVDLPAFRAVVVMPRLHCSTAAVYAAHDELVPVPRAGVPNRDESRLGALSRPRSTGRGRDARGTGEVRLVGPPSRWAGALFNDLRPAAERVCPALAGVAGRLAEAAGLPVHLTGSGSGMFILADDDASAEAVLARLPADLRAVSVAVRSNPW